jgi:hypothetical protein
MAKVRPCSLVIDASITHAAGDRESDRSRQCTAFLVAILDFSHRIVVSGPWLEEWQEHRSRYARSWLTKMYARRLVVKVIVKGNPKMRSQVERAAPSEKVASELVKDLHLIEAALISDKRIASLDDEARNYFSQAAQSIRALGTICWVNPERPEELPIEWLKAGAPHEEHRMLGYVPPEE